MGGRQTPKVYFLKRKGWELLRSESDLAEEQIGPFLEVHQEVTWSPQMYHRLRLLNLFIALEVQARSHPNLALLRTFLEYRRVKRSHERETTDYVSDQEIPENRIVPDGVFVLENTQTGRRGLFFVEMDMGTERIVAKGSADRRATVHGKFEQYDRYLTSGRFARTYAACGDFRRATILFVTLGKERIENIRQAASNLPLRFHQYYRLATLERAMNDFLVRFGKVVTFLTHCSTVSLHRPRNKKPGRGG